MLTGMLIIQLAVLTWQFHMAGADGGGLVKVDCLLVYGWSTRPPLPPCSDAPTSIIVFARQNAQLCLGRVGK